MIVKITFFKLVNALYGKILFWMRNVKMFFSQNLLAFILYITAKSDRCVLFHEN